MKNKSYGEKLLDPRWQRKRLEILLAADFTCEACGSKTETLQVHHGYYEKGRMPWEYDNESLLCLCDKCHKERQLLEDKIKRCLLFFNSSELDILYSEIIQSAFLDGVQSVCEKLKRCSK